MVIYKITQVFDEKSYIGQTVKTPNARWIEHISDSVRGSSTYLHKAIRKYGPDAFVVEVLQVCESKEEMDLAEMFYISFLNTRAPNGYNLTDGGDGAFGAKITEETRRKLSESHKGKDNHQLGRKHTIESRKKMSESSLGHPGYWLGKHRSEDTKQKLIKAHTGKKLSKEHKQKLRKSTTEYWKRKKSEQGIVT